MLENRDVIAVDQDAIPASRIHKADTAGSDLDHRGGAWPAGQPGWLSGQGPLDRFRGEISAAGQIQETVVPEGVALLRVRPVG